jgi:hypothetical protein
MRLGYIILRFTEIVATRLQFTMIEIRKTDVFAAWLDGLRDMQARLRVLVRIERLAGGNPGDV